MATCAGDALVGNTTTGVRNEKRVALRNVHVVDNPVFPVKVLVHMYPVRPFIKIGELAIDPGELQGGRVTIAIDQRSERPLRPLAGKTMSFRRSESATTDRGVKRFELDLPRQARRSLAPAHLPRVSGIELSRSALPSWKSNGCRQSSSNRTQRTSCACCNLKPRCLRVAARS